MIQAHEDALQVRLTPDDVESAQMAGVRFARALAGAPSAAFMLALAEQEQLVRSAIEDPGVSERVARIAAEAFEAVAMTEWGRITLAAGQGAMGNA